MSAEDSRRVQSSILVFDITSMSNTKMKDTQRFFAIVVFGSV